MCVAVVCGVSTAVTVPGPASAGEEPPEVVEVTAPNLCCVPSGLGTLTGWGPPSSGPAGVVSLKSAALKSSKANVRALKKKRDEKPKPPEEKSSIWEKVLGWLKDTVDIVSKLVTIEKAASNAGNDRPAPKHMQPDGTVRIQKFSREIRNDGTWTETESIMECQGSADFVKEACIMREIYEIVDPTDGMIRFSYHLAVVRPVYMPKHIDADKNGYAPQVVDGQEIWLVFDTYTDLEQQLAELRLA